MLFHVNTHGTYQTQVLVCMLWMSLQRFTFATRNQ